MNTKLFGHFDHSFWRLALGLLAERASQPCSAGSGVRDYRCIKRALNLVEISSTPLYSTCLSSDTDHSINVPASLENRVSVTRQTGGVIRYTGLPVTRKPRVSNFDVTPRLSFGKRTMYHSVNEFDQQNYLGLCEYSS